MSFEVITDSCANLPESMIDEYGLHVLPLTFNIEGEEYRSYVKGETTDLKQFYTFMREGKVVTTSLPHLNEVEETARDILNRGKDVLYLGFSSGLSGTFQSVSFLMDDLSTEYSNQKIICVDTLAAALGQGLLVYYVMEMVKNGASIQEAAIWAEENKQKMAHWFTVDDLMFLFSGGRVSKTSAWAGTLLNIKPVLHVDSEGRLVAMEKLRGRKKALQALVGHMEKTGIAPMEDQVVFISHGDCIEDAELVADMIRQKWNVKKVVINCLDPVIGAHAGPGTVALFYLAKDRD